MDAIKRSLGVSRMDWMRNEDLKERMRVKKTVIEDIEERQLIWYGHVQRLPDERLPKQVVDGRRSEGNECLQPHGTAVGKLRLVEIRYWTTSLNVLNRCSMRNLSSVEPPE